MYASESLRERGKEG